MSIPLFVFSLTTHTFLRFGESAVAASAESFDHCQSSSPVPGLALSESPSVPPVPEAALFPCAAAVRFLILPQNREKVNHSPEETPDSPRVILRLTSFPPLCHNRGEKQEEAQTE